MRMLHAFIKYQMNFVARLGASVYVADIAYWRNYTATEAELMASLEFSREMNKSCR